MTTISPLQIKQAKFRVIAYPAMFAYCVVLMLAEELITETTSNGPSVLSRTVSGIFLAAVAVICLVELAFWMLKQPSIISACGTLALNVVLPVVAAIGTASVLLNLSLADSVKAILLGASIFVGLAAFVWSIYSIDHSMKVFNQTNVDADSSEAL